MNPWSLLLSSCKVKLLHPVIYIPNYSHEQSSQHSTVHLQMSFLSPTFLQIKPTNFFTTLTPHFPLAHSVQSYIHNTYFVPSCKIPASLCVQLGTSAPSAKTNCIPILRFLIATLITLPWMMLLSVPWHLCHVQFEPNVESWACTQCAGRALP